MFKKKKKEEEIKVEKVLAEDDKEVVEEVVEEVVDRVLYVVMDKEIPDMGEFMRGLGIDVYAVYRDIEGVRNPLLMSSEPSRLVMLETGTGLLTSTKNREQLLDIVGMQDDETLITVFYTDDSIRRDAMRRLGKGNKAVEWVEYTTTLEAMAHILKYGERYILDEYASVGDDIGEGDMLKYTGILYDRDIECTKDNLSREDLSSLVSEELVGIESFSIDV